MDSDANAASDPSRHSRRDFLQRTLGGAAVVGVGGLLAACGSGSGSGTTSSSTTTTTSAANKPKRGGSLRLASSGGGTSDTLDGNNCVENLDFARAPQLYDCLMEVDANAIPQPALAEELTPNADATEWTIRIRKGVVFHNGKPFTIDDVLYTFNRIITNKFAGASGLAFMDLKNAKKLDAYTVKIPMTAGYSILPITLIGDGEMSIVPEGYNPKKPVGTGAFKYESFTPGSTSTFTRNDNYWRTGEPYFDSVVITDYADETAQVNALLSNAADCADQLSNASIATLKAGGKTVKIWEGPGWVPFTMRLDAAPFSDNRVRQAMRLVVDRAQMREVVFGGYGLIGNDIFGINGADYDTSIPQRSQDIAQAKSLLKKAGQENLTVTLVTAPIKTGAVSDGHRPQAAGERRGDHDQPQLDHQHLVLRPELPEVGLCPGLVERLPLHSSGRLLDGARSALGRDPLEHELVRTEVLQHLQGSTSYRRPDEASRARKRDADDGLQLRRLHHPGVQPRDRGPGEQPAGGREPEDGRSVDPVLPSELVVQLIPLEVRTTGRNCSPRRAASIASLTRSSSNRSEMSSSSFRRPD